MYAQTNFFREKIVTLRNQNDVKRAKISLEMPPNSIDRMIKNKQSSFQYNIKLTISFIIPLPGVTPSFASHCDRSGCVKDINVD